MYFHNILTYWKILINPSPRLSKIRQSWSSHPNNKVLIFGINPLIWRTIRTSLESLPLISTPTDILLRYSDISISTIELKSIIEERISYIYNFKPIDPQGLATASGKRGTFPQLKFFPIWALVIKGQHFLI